MKTAFKLSRHAGQLENSPASFFDRLEEAENALPAGYARQGETPPGDVAHFRVTEFTYPDLIADRQLGWEQAEIVKDLYYY